MRKGIQELSYQTPIIPPTQLVVVSYSAYEMHAQPRLNPTKAVGGSFIRSLTNAPVLNLSIRHLDRLNMNEPPTALVGFSVNDSMRSAFSAACHVRPVLLSNRRSRGISLESTVRVQIK
jgi:hypothetical protein